MRARRPPVLHRLGEAAASLGRRPPRHPAVRVLLQAGLTALVLGFLIFTVVDEWQELQQQNLHVSAGWLAPALAAMLAFQAGTGLIWLLQLRMLDQAPRPLGAQLAWMKSLLARYVPGGILFVVSRVILTEREGVPRRITLTAMAYETGLAFAGAGAVAAWFLIASDQTDAWLGWASAAAVVIALICMHPRLFAPIVNRLLTAFGREALPTTISPPRLLALFVLDAGVFALSGVGMWCVARALYPASGADLAVIVGAQALAFCASVVTLVFPGGLGVRDGVFAWAITPIVPGDSFAIAAAIALAGRLVWTASEVLYLGILSAAERRSPGSHPDKGGPISSQHAVERRLPGLR